MNIQQSVAEVLDDQTAVTQRFYEEFLARYPDVEKFFENVDLVGQAIKLSMTLPVIQMHYENGFQATRDYLELLGHKHRLLNIPKELYPEFRDCLLETLKEFHGDDWSEELETEWSQAIEKATDAVLAGYRSTRFD